MQHVPVELLSVSRLVTLFEGSALSSVSLSIFYFYIFICSLDHVLSLCGVIHFVFTSSLFTLPKTVTQVSLRTSRLKIIWLCNPVLLSCYLGCHKITNHWLNLEMLVWFGLFPGTLGMRWKYILDRTSVHHSAAHTFRIARPPTGVVLGDSTKLENPEETHIDMRWRCGK